MMNMVNVQSTLPDRYETREAFKTLRTNVLFASSDVKAIAITSSTQNEGKSIISFELAKSFAEIGKKTLLIDADLRKSVFATKHTTETGMFGLSHYLSGQSGIDDVIYKTQNENLYVIFSGPFPPNPVELVASQKFSELLSQCKEAFDYIIIDTPPISYVIDGAVIASMCDGTIITIASNRLNARTVQATKEQLERGNCRIIGTVLNMIDTESNEYNSAHGYYNKYYKYYRSKYGYYSSKNTSNVTFSELNSSQKK